MDSNNGKKRFLNNEQRKRIIEMKEEGILQKDIADFFCVSEAAISKILSKKEKYMELFASPFYNPKAFNTRGPKFPNLEMDMKEFEDDVRGNNYLLTGHMIKRQAKVIHESSEERNEDFKASEGWKSRHTKRMKLAYGSLHGEAGSVPTDLGSLNEISFVCSLFLLKTHTI